MKSIKLIVAIVVILSIGLFSFNNTTSQSKTVQNEFLTILIISGKVIVYSNGQEISKEKLSSDPHKDLSLLFNKYGQEGWTLKTSTSQLWSAWNFERAKQ